MVQSLQYIVILFLCIFCGDLFLSWSSPPSPPSISYLFCFYYRVLEPLSISRVSWKRLRRVSRALNARLCTNEIVDRGHACVAYAWTPATEAQQCPEIVNHLRTCLPFLEDRGFKLVDVHTDHDLLTTDTFTRVNMRGGTDAAIVPRNAVGYSEILCVAFEFKNPAVVAATDSLNQAIAKVLAVRCLSSQPEVAVVLTDMTATAMIFRSAPTADGRGIAVYESTTTLSGMVAFLDDFLNPVTGPVVNTAMYFEPDDAPLAVWKRSKEDPNIDDDLETLLPLCNSNAERAQVLRQELFYKRDLTPPSWLSMYS